MIIYVEGRDGMADIKHVDIKQNASIDMYSTDRFKSEMLSVYFSLPTVKEEAVIRTLLLSVLKRGTEKYPSQKEINARLDDLFATILSLENQRFDATQLFGLCADVIRDEYISGGEELLSGALEVATQIMLCPYIDAETGLFSEEYVSSEKINYKNSILSQMNEPRSYASLRCREETFSQLGLSYKLSEILEMIDKITARDLTEYYKKVIKTAGYRIFYTGARTQEEIERRIIAALPSEDYALPTNEKAASKELVALPVPNVIIEEKDVFQGRLSVSVSCGVTWRDMDYPAMLMCNEILGGSPISKLMMGVREARGLCYECSSEYNSARGVLFINLGIDVQNFDAAKEAIAEQIDAIKPGDITEAEFSAAKKSLLNVYKSVYDSPVAIEKFYLGRIVSGIDTDIEDMLEKVSGVTMEDVVAVADKLSFHTVFFLKGTAEEGDYDEE